MLSQSPAPRRRALMTLGASLVALAAHPALAQTADPLLLDTITVQAAAETGASPVVGLGAPALTATATRTDTPLIETPQSITVVGATQIAQTGATSLSQAMEYAPGVTTFGSDDGTGDSLMTRGFRLDPFYGNVFRDGMRAAVNVFDGSQEVYGLERVELLRGPASVLYGQGGPAGVLNMVSKRPVFTPLRELSAELGSYERKQIAGDFGGPLGPQEQLAWRLTGLWRESETFVDYVPDDRRFLAPAMTWRSDGGATTLTFLGLYQHDRTAYVYGLPPEGTISRNPNGRIPRHRFVGEPGFDKFEATQYSATLLFEHAFSDALTLRSGARYYYSDQNFPSVWASGLHEDGRTIDRGAQDRTDWSESATFDAALQYDWAWGATTHTTLGGFDMSQGEHQTKRWNRTADPLDLFDPVYSRDFGPAEPALWSDRDRTRRYGLYLQDQMRLGENWALTLGGRQDWVDYSDWGVFTGDTLVDDERTDAFTGRAGLVYLGPWGLAPYVGFSQSFEPTGGLDRNGNRFKPTTGEQYEVGLRWIPPSRPDLMLTAAAYQITQQNVTVSDPVDPNFMVQDGEVRSRGAELELRGAATENLDLILSYAYTDARTIKSSPLTPENDGKRTGNVPYNQASLWASYSYGRFGLPGLTTALGLRYVGSMVPYGAMEGVIPSYTVVDAMASYETDRWTLRLNASNLADKVYVTSCTYACFWGDPREVSLTASYRW